ncbi:MAG: VWA domain-containing protein [Acidobacteria bacterium]|nr:VWA domain-containing protein [Acidobacteriota bacterium]
MKKMWAPFVILVLAGIAWSQRAPGEKEFKIGVESNLVSLPVSARFLDGSFARDLKKEEFHIYEDGVEQRITHFAPESVPFHAVLLIDASESVRSEVGAIKLAARRFASELKPGDKVSLITFNYDNNLILDWTDDPQRVDEALGSIFPHGRTVLYDALYVTFEDQLKNVDGKKVVVLLTDGMDFGSRLGHEEAFEAAARSNAVISVVSMTEAVRYSYEYHRRQDPLSPSVPLEAFVQARNFLRKLAYESGGTVIYPDSFGMVQDAFHRIAEELHNQYAIGYVPYNVMRDGKYRNIEIRVDRPNVVVSTRRGYYAPKEPGG